MNKKGQTISVLITAWNEPQLNRTIKNLYNLAEGKIEVIVSLDGPKEAKVDKRAVVIRHDDPVGRRKGFNLAAKQATGKYLFIVVAHCFFNLT